MRERLYIPNVYYPEIVGMDGAGNLKIASITLNDPLRFRKFAGRVPIQTFYGATNHGTQLSGADPRDGNPIFANEFSIYLIFLRDISRIFCSYGRKLPVNRTIKTFLF